MDSGSSSRSTYPAKSFDALSWVSSFAAAQAILEEAHNPSGEEGGCKVTQKVEAYLADATSHRLVSPLTSINENAGQSGQASASKEQESPQAYHHVDDGAMRTEGGWDPERIGGKAESHTAARGSTTLQAAFIATNKVINDPPSSEDAEYRGFNIV